jgi:hypothetical protein
MLSYVNYVKFNYLKINYFRKKSLIDFLYKAKGQNLLINRIYSFPPVCNIFQKWLKTIDKYHFSE